ncbi:hypothetical protein J5N97_014309 [Dioscorea zingiberensis]|uniref:Uncharacterized protein n=1 Tax=Dioscorea zingiberensis TaxID=325984 RepID=A0A9D5CUZ5_9LILI|nr:hypothetical protein J5N97_014309 [Dioscorea zingiberensis]
MVVTRSRAAAGLRHTLNTIPKRRSLRLLGQTLAPSFAPSPISSTGKKRVVKKRLVKKPAAKKLSVKKHKRQKATAPAKEPEPQQPCRKPKPVAVRTMGQRPRNFAFVGCVSEQEATSPFMGSFAKLKVPIARSLVPVPTVEDVMAEGHRGASPVVSEPVLVVDDEGAEGHRVASPAVTDAGSSCVGVIGD